MSSAPPRKKITFLHQLLTVVVLLIGSLLIIALIPLVIFNDLVFGRYRGWNYNYNLFKGIFRVGYFITNIRIKMRYLQPHNRNNRYVFVFNHSSFLDVPVMMTAIKQPVRALGIYGPTKIPVFGYYYRKLTVQVDREDAVSRLKSFHKLKHYLQKNISIVVFPEGGFNYTSEPLDKFYDGAFRIAIDTQTNIKPVIMPDNYDRCYYYGLSLEPGPCRIIYLEEVSVQGLTPKDIPFLREKVRAIMAEALVRHGAGWIDRSGKNDA
jgi:1-acyl-sn-glycerol-3-phosphate acyltransferase